MKDFSKQKRNLDVLPEDEHTLGGPGDSSLNNKKTKLKRKIKRELRKNGNKNSKSKKN